MEEETVAETQEDGKAFLNGMVIFLSVPSYHVYKLLYRELEFQLLVCRTVWTNTSGW
ncbi:hypothetical protein K432DRAFT_32541 [Lepidopterella palustris CBS 459.81]|uniref:Uncharacterized protein n=1 Tax=Lepidopterella palustris CBS 459.81 TaxID=1314670 RepID=A0A8E2DWC7_9PEZI|nr:hypothetical protein K432DRAFT_32541 [Lepidopterella palustris CBS 459.81]